MLLDDSDLAASLGAAADFSTSSSFFVAVSASADGASFSFVVTLASSSDGFSVAISFVVSDVCALLL